MTFHCHSSLPAYWSHCCSLSDEGLRRFPLLPVLLVFLSSLRATLAVLCSTTASWWESLPTEEESVASWKSLEFTPSSRTTPSGLTVSWAHRPLRRWNQAVKSRRAGGHVSATFLLQPTEFCYSSCILKCLQCMFMFWLTTIIHFTTFYQLTL